MGEYRYLGFDVIVIIRSIRNLNIIHKYYIVCSWSNFIKIGEALVRATRELGELTPAYRNGLLNTLMAGSVSADGLTLLYCQGWQGAGAGYP